MRKSIASLIVIFLVSFYNPLKSHPADGIPLKLRVGTYNVGHFNQGKLGGYQGEDVQEEMERWRTWIGQQSMDIFMITEWNNGFDKDSTLNATEALLKPFYNNIYFGKANTWIYNGIATNLELKNLRQVDLTHKEYYAIVGDLQIREKIITIMSVHIPWQECCHESSVDALISEMQKYEYVICGGDMNAPNKNQRKFYDAGFNIANGGHEGWHCTAAKRCDNDDAFETRNIDNIITSKNIKIMNVSAPHTALSNEDHWPILADVVVTW